MSFGDNIVTLFFLIGCAMAIGTIHGWRDHDAIYNIASALITFGFFTVAISIRARYIAAGVIFVIGAAFSMYYCISNWEWSVRHMVDATCFCCVFLIPGTLLIAKGLKCKRTISISYVDVMTGPQFEEFCADVLRRSGFGHVQLMGGSGDQGVDIIAINGGMRYAIQCKRYSGKLGNTPVQEVFAGQMHYGCDLAAVMTNSYFTPGAVELAGSTRVLLWDRDWIMSRIQEDEKEKHGKIGSGIKAFFKRRKTSEGEILKDALLEYLPHIENDFHFIFLCSDILESYNFHYVQIKGGEIEYSTHMVGKFNDEWYAISCIYEKEQIGIEEVKDVLNGKIHYGVECASVMTVGSFTKDAMEFAAKNEVNLWGYEWIISHPPKRTAGLEQYALMKSRELEGRKSFDFPVTKDEKALSEEDMRLIMGEELKWRRQQITGDEEK